MGKRTAIIQAAIAAFQENGVEKTKISDIVKKAQIAQGTFYLYFPSKLALMPAIAEVMVEKTMEVVQKTVKEKALFERKLELLVDAIFLVTEEYHDVLALIYSGLAATEHLKEWETVYAPFYEWLSQFLQEGKAKGEIRSSIQPDRTAKLIIGLIESAAEQIYLYDVSQEDQARIQKAEVNEFLRYALGMEEK